MGQGASDQIDSLVRRAHDHDPQSSTASSTLSGRVHEVTCALPIDREASDLHRLWLEAQTQRLVMAHIADVTAAGDIWHWKAHAKWLGDVEWDSRVTATEPSGRIAWRSLDGAELPNEGELVFGAGRPGWGTEVRLTWRFDPPGGVLGDLAARGSNAPAGHRGAGAAPFQEPRRDR